MITESYCELYRANPIINYLIYVFDLTESNQFKVIFIINHRVTFDFSYDLKEQYKSVYGIEITVSLLYCVFGSKIIIHCLNFF